MNITYLFRLLSAVCMAAIACMFFPAAAQPAPLVVEKLPYKGSMPFVEAGGGAPATAAAVAARINQAIYLSVLEKAAPARRQEGIKAVAKKADEGPEPVSGISYKVHRLDARVVSLVVSFEGCGAYCEGQQMSFSFDARSGREIVAPDLFTPEGMKAVTALLDRAEQARLVAHLKRLRTPPTAVKGKNSKAAEPEETEDAEARIEMFESCLKSSRDPERHKFGSPAEASFHVEAARIVFSRGRCSNHAMQALDELGDFTGPLEARTLEPHLSGYGKYLVLNGPPAAQPPSPYRSVMKGKVGTAPITLRLRSPGYEQSVSGHYFYDRFRTPIPLFGKWKGEVLELAEEAPEGKEAPLLKLKVEGDGLKGEWVGGGKRLPVEVAP